MSSWIVLDKNYAELKMNDSVLGHLREVMLKISKEWNVSDESPVIKFINTFYGSIYLEIVDDLIEKSNIELFGKLFLAAVKNSDSEGYFDYFVAPTDPKLQSLYYNTLLRCYDPIDCCENCIVRVNREMFLRETGSIFKEDNYSAEFYELGNKILEFAQKLQY